MTGGVVPIQLWRLLIRSDGRRERRGTNLKVAGLGFASLVTTIIGLILVVVGLALGVMNGLILGSMVGLLVGIAAIVVGAFIIKD